MRRFAWLCLTTVLAMGFGQQKDGLNRASQAQDREAGMAAFRAAMVAEPAARDATLRGLVSTAHEEVAKDSLIALIRLHALDVETLSLGLLPKLSDLSTRSVLGAAERTRDFHFRMAVARAALQRIADDPTLNANPRNEEGGAGTAGLAARLLADSENIADRDLICRVARARPHDPGLWLALAKLGIANAADISLARSVMQDAKAPRWARLAAAAALAPADSDAKAYVTGGLTTFLSTFGQTTAESVLAEAYRQPQINQDPGKAVEFQPGLLMIGILEFLQTPDAERLTFEHLDATNMWVRTGLGLVAAMRWPNRLLDSVPSHFDESIKLRAALSVLHPELLSRVRALVPPDDLEKWRSKMLKDGVETVFSSPGNAGLVF